jgi:hypothetical protein
MKNNIVENNIFQKKIDSFKKINSIKDESLKILDSTIK